MMKNMEELESGVIVIWNGKKPLIDTLKEAINSLNTSIIELKEKE